MVRGIESFKKWFRGHEDKYTIIGGTACDLLMAEAGLDFRATKDIDLVLIVEALEPSFGRLLWEYVTAAGYQHRRKSSSQPQFYRFTHPRESAYPAMIELFSRKPDSIVLPPDARLSPLPFEEEISSLSAILLDDDYYDFLKRGRISLSGVVVLDAPYLIPFKAKAWVDLSRKKQAGEAVDEKNVRKHKNDVFRLSELLNPNLRMLDLLPGTVKKDMAVFIEAMERETIDIRQIGIRGKDKEGIIEELRAVYLMNDR